MFRVAVKIDKPVNIKILKEAAAHMMKRCPYYQVTLESGLFWFYLEKTKTLPLIHADSIYPCQYIPYQKKDALAFRILAYRNRIAFEPAHLLADGRSALIFLNGLVLEYLKLRGEEVSSDGLIMDCEDDPDPEEFRDSYQKNFDKIVPNPPPQPMAAQVKGRHLRPPGYRITEGRIPTAELKSRARAHGVTIGEYITALLIKVNLDEERKKKRMKPVVITIPIDIRQFFPSKTMRNFLLTTEPYIDPRLGDFTFDDIVRKVHHYMAYEVDDRMVKTQIARNIRGEKGFYIRIIPLLLKRPILKLINRRMGELKYTMSFSNLGRVKLPPGMEPFIQKYEFLPPRSYRTVNATALGFGDYTHIFFGSTLKENTIEASFFAEARKLGIPVKIGTNIPNTRSE